MNISMLIVLGIVDIILVIILLFELKTFNSVKNEFTCKHCGTLNSEISNNHTCIKCNRRMKLESKTWEYFFLFRVNWIHNNKDYSVYKYKDYIKLPKIELSIIVISICIITIEIIMCL